MPDASLNGRQRGPCSTSRAGLDQRLESRRALSTWAVDEVLAVLEAVPGLSALPQEELEALARALTRGGLHEYGDGHAFYCGQIPDSSEPLRLLIHGMVIRHPWLSRDQAGSWTLSAGSWLGLLAVDAWARRRELQRRWAEVEMGGIDARAVGKVWTLELPASAFEALFDAAPGLLERLLGLVGVTLHAPAIVARLRQTRTFGEAPLPALHRALEAARSICVEPGARFEARPWALYYACTGIASFERARGPDHPARSQTLRMHEGELEPLGEGLSGPLRGRGPLRADMDRPLALVELPWHALLDALGPLPGYAGGLELQRARESERAEGDRAGDLAPRAARPHGQGSRTLPPPPLPEARWTWLVDDRAPNTRGTVEPLLTGLCEALAGFEERAICLHLRAIPTREADLATPEDPAPAYRILEGVELPGTALSLHLGGGSSIEADLDTIARWRARLDPYFDHVLVDSSALAPAQAGASPIAELWRLLARAPGSRRLAWLMDDVHTWAELPARLGPLPRLPLLPVACLPAAGATRMLSPEPRPNQTKSDSRGEPSAESGSGSESGPEPLPERIARALARSLPPRRSSLHSAPSTAGAARRRAIESELHGAQSSALPWPLDAPRMTLADDLPGSCARLARALTHRRVGLSIGGGGVQAYVAIPFLQRLQRAGIPLDLLSGTSVGAFIATFYAIDGDAGLRALTQRWLDLQVGIAACFVDNMPLTRWLVHETHGLDLSQVPLPVVLVSMNASTCEAHLHTAGLAAKACMASGSLPPMAPTLIGAARLLDGALVQDVPAAVLASSGANLLTLVLPLPPLATDPDALANPRTGVHRRLRSFNPMLRFWDFSRGHLGLARRAAENGVPYADVVYRATTRKSRPGFVFQGERVMADAASSEALDRSVRAMEDRWARLRARSPTRLRVDPRTGRVELGEDLRALLRARVTTRADGQPSLSLPEAGLELLERLRVFDLEAAEAGTGPGTPRLELELPRREERGEGPRARLEAELAARCNLYLDPEPIPSAEPEPERRTLARFIHPTTPES